MRIKAQYFGLDPSVDEQVLKLLKNGIINTCSIIVNNYNLNIYYSKNLILENNATDLMKNCQQKGLMINLTQGCSLKLPLHIDGLEEIHQIPEISNIIASIMEQEFGVYEIHFQMRNILLSERETNQQIQLINQLIKVYCAYNIKPVIYMEQEDLYFCKGSLNKINTRSLRNQFTIDSQSYALKASQLIFSKISQIIKKISSDQNQLNKTNILIYSKINPATGNQTFALRLKKILDMKYMNGRKVFLRGIDQLNQNDEQSFQNQVKNLSQFIKENKIGMCLGTDAYEFLENEVTAQQMKEACDQSTLVISVNEEMKQIFLKNLAYQIIKYQ
ncbi:hypothetical protein ABPG72_006869 [Tetrahymena utriculariae]